MGEAKYAVYIVVVEDTEEHDNAFDFAESVERVQGGLTLDAAIDLAYERAGVV